MDCNQENITKVVTEYANDLCNLGILQSPTEFWAFYSEHGAPGNELQTLHRFISDYFKSKLGTIPDDVLDKEAQTLMKIFPGYNKHHARFLLYYYGAEPNRVEIVMRIMLLHSNNQPKAGNADQHHQPEATPSSATTSASASGSQTFDQLVDIGIGEQVDHKPYIHGTRKVVFGPGPICPPSKLATGFTNSQLLATVEQQQRAMFAGKYTWQCQQPNAAPDQRQSRRSREPPSATIVRPTDEEAVNKIKEELVFSLKGIDTGGRAEGTGRQKVVVQPARFDPGVYLPLDHSNSSPKYARNEGQSTSQAPKDASPARVEVVGQRAQAQFLKATRHLKTRVYDNSQAMNLIVQPNTEVHVVSSGSNPTNNIFLQQVVYKTPQNRENKEPQQLPEQNPTRGMEDGIDLSLDDEMGDRRDIAIRRRRPFGDHRDERPSPKYVRLGAETNTLEDLGLVDLDAINSDSSVEENYQNSDWLSASTTTDSDEDSDVTMIVSPKNPKRPRVSVEAAFDGDVSSSTSYNVKLVSHVMEMFPDACPMYVRKLCRGRSMTGENVDEVIQMIFKVPEYPKRRQKAPSPEPELDFDTQVELLKEILPDADPTYLESQAQLYLGDNEAMKQFIAHAVDHRNYPTMKEYLRRQQLNAQVKQYTTEFDVEKFLEVIPDPEAHFRAAEGKMLEDPVERHLCIQVLKNLYSSLLVRVVMAVFNARQNLIVTANELDDMVTDPKNIMKSKRKQVPVDLSALQNIPILQEIAYLNNRTLILNTIKEKKLVEMKQREEAKANNLMQTCNCCFDDEVMLNDVFHCENECAPFCRNCVQRSAEVKLGEGKLDIPCFKECTPTAVFSLKTLKVALNPKLFSKLAQKKQLEEVKAAGIEDLVMCPFCDFATIPPPGDKIFKCLNPECMKESCRECKEPSHVPLRCDEIEKDSDVQKRTYIENKMTEALLRTCYNCNMKYIKEDGCNKMTCSRCFAQMCYICLQPVKDYKHFNGQGGDKHQLCPLYSDTNKMHADQVLKGAQQAKDELGLNDKKLKIDPTSDVQKHYNTRKTGCCSANLNRYLLQMQQIAPGHHNMMEEWLNNRMDFRDMMVPIPGEVLDDRAEVGAVRPGTPRVPRHHHHHHHHHHHNRQNH